MAHENIDLRRSMVGKVLSAGIRIGSREAKLLGVVFNCSPSAIQADAKIVRADAIRSTGRRLAAFESSNREVLRYPTPDE
jgi:hypothetical protein